MGKKRRSSGGGQTNSDRKCGKAWKKVKKKQRKTGRTINGYSPAKLELRAAKRAM